MGGSLWPARTGKIAAAYVVFALLAASALAGVSLFTSLFVGDLVTLEVVVPSAILKGWGQVWITYPGGHAYASVPLDGRDYAVVFSFNMSEVRGKASRVLAELSQLGVVEYATLYFTAYIIDGNGSMCIATYKYSTLDYYLEKTGSPAKALQLARQNPLALLEAGRLVVKRGKMSDCTPVNIQLEKAARGLSPTGIRVSPQELKPPTTKPGGRGGLPLGEGLESINPSPPPWPPCPLRFAEVYFPGLYYQRDEPPHIWLDRVLLDPSIYWSEEDRQRVIGDLWKDFATKFSLAYFFPSYCTAEDAVISAGFYTDFPEGIHTMDHVIVTLAYDLGYTLGVNGWADEYKEGTMIKVYDKAPIARITMVYAGQQSPSKPEFEVQFVVIKDTQEVIGVTFMGKIILGSEEVFKDIWSNSTSVYPALDWSSIGFIYAPLKIKYKFDAILVHYVVDKVTVNSIEYWRVVPLYYYAPYYTFIYNYDYMNSIHDSYVNPHNEILINELNNAFIELTSLNDYPDYYMDWTRVYTGTIYPGGSPLTLDTNRIAVSTRLDLGWLITFLANAAVSKVLSGLGSTFHSLSTMASPLVGVTMVKMVNTLVEVKLIVDRDYNMPTVNVAIDKLSPLPEFLSEYYSQIGEYPLLYTYSVVVYGP